MYNTFILSYDPQMSDPSPMRLAEFVRSNGYTYQYFIPFLGTILIKSSATVIQLIDSYSPFIRPFPFMLSQLYPALMTGMLAQAQWDWINATAPLPLPGQ